MALSIFHVFTSRDYSRCPRCYLDVP